MYILGSVVDFRFSFFIFVLFLSVSLISSDLISFLSSLWRITFQELCAFRYLIPAIEHYTTSD